MSAPTYADREGGPNDFPKYNDPQLGAMAGQTQGPNSQIEDHSQRLIDVRQSLERALSMYDNMLVGLRGNVPQDVGGDNAKVQVEPPLMERLNGTTIDLHNLADKLNNVANELREFI